MAEVDFSDWQQADWIHFRGRTEVRAKNPLVPGGRAPAAPPKPEQVPLLPVKTDSPEDIAREADELALVEDERLDRLVRRVRGIVGDAGPRPDMVDGEQERGDERSRLIFRRMAAVLEKGSDIHSQRAAATLSAKALADEDQNSDLFVANDPIESPAEEDMSKVKKGEKSPKTTYYNEFPTEPRPKSVIVHVFWVVANDYRALSESERRNIVYPAKFHELMEAAPKDDRMVQINLKGEVSRCKYILTKKGQEYYEQHILPLIDKDFVSVLPPVKAQRSKKKVSTASLRG